MEEFVCLNGAFVSSAKLLFAVSNRSFHYGDGCFETMKLVNGKIALWNYHQERLLKSLQTLKMVFPSSFSIEKLYEQIIQLTIKNNQSISRVRLTCFRGNGSLYHFNQPFEYLIESFAPAALSDNNSEGIKINFYEHAIKHYDAFSFIKSNNYLSSVMASMYAKENKLDDVVLLNTNGFIAETSIANIFIIKDGIIKTPCLQQGCIEGTMRSYLIDGCKKDNIQLLETIISKNDVLNADEVFITNAIRGLEWVAQCSKSVYSNKFSRQLHEKYIQPLWQ